MAGGRPTKYRREHCQTVVDLGKLGKSKAQIAAALDVAINTLDAWASEHPEFLLAMTRAHDASLCWWEEKAQNSLDAPVFQASLWAKSVSCRFPEHYRERTETRTRVEIESIPDEDLDGRIAELLRKTGVGTAAGGEAAQAGAEKVADLLP